MQEIIDFSVSLPIKSLVLRFVMYTALNSLLISSLASLIFNDGIDQLALSLNAIIGGCAALLAESFGKRRFEAIAKNASNPSRQWLRLQDAVRTKALPKQKKTLEILPAFIEESLRLRHRTQLYGPGLFLLTAAVNITIALAFDQYILLVPSGIFLLFAVSFFVGNIQKLRGIRYLQRRLNE